LKGKIEITDTATLGTVKDSPIPLLLYDACVASAVTVQGCADDDHSDDEEDNFFFDIDDSSVKCDDNKIACCHTCGSLEEPPSDTSDNENAIEASPHQQISCVAPKDKHFSALSDHVALVVITDSVGYEVGVTMIFEELGVELPCHYSVLSLQKWEMRVWQTVQSTLGCKRSLLFQKTEDQR